MSSPTSSPPLSSNSDQTLVNASATGEVITTFVIVLFILFVVSLILYIRAKHYVGITGRTRLGLDFAPAPRDPICRRQPLDPWILASIPVTVIGYKGATDCAVCLSELAEGEKARFLPECGHGFHVECIDMWFASNSTCPLCRVQVGAAQVRVCVSSDEGCSSGESSSSGKVAVPSDSPLAPAPMERLWSVRRAWTRGFDIEQGAQSWLVIDS